MKKLIVTAAILLTTATVMGGMYLLGLETPKQLTETPEFSIEVRTLLNEFSANQIISNHKYLDKIIQVHGVLKSVTTVSNGINIDLSGDYDNEAISCNMDSSVFSRCEQLIKGKQITIKGRCGGYLEEELLGMKNISLVQCSIIK